MKKQILTLTSALILASSINAGDMLTGDTKLACEAILCLSNGTRPSECSPSLDRYFSIKKKKFKDTINARRNFLKLCPTDDADKNDPVFADLIYNVLPNVDARKCTADYINQNPDKECIKDRCGEHRCGCVEYKYKPATKMPVGCEALIKHAYTNIRPVNTCGNTRWYSESEWDSKKAYIDITEEEYNNLKSTGAMNIKYQPLNSKYCQRGININFKICNRYYKIQDIKDCWVNEE